MKKFLSVTILCFSLIAACFSQVNLNQQAVIRPNDGNFFTVLQNGLAKRVNQKELQDTFSKNILKGALIGYWEDVLSVSDSVDFNTIRPFTRFGTNIPNGWYVYSVTTESNGINTITRKLYNVGVNIDDNIVETVTLKNGWQLLVRFQNNIAVSHYINYGGFTTIDYMIDLLSIRVTAEQAARIAADNAINATVATKANQISLNNTNVQVQKNVDSLVIHRNELNARADSIMQLRLALNTKADSTLAWKIGGNWYQSGAERKLGLRTNLGRATNWNSLTNFATRMSFGLNTDSTADFYSKLSFSSIGLNYSRAMLNFTTPLLAASNPQSPRGVISFNMPTGAGALRMFVSTYNPTIPFDGNTSNTNGSYGFEITPNSNVSGATLDSSQYGNGSRLRFYYTRIGGLQPNSNISSFRGIEFRDSLIHLSQNANSANFDKGYIVSDATLGKIAVRRYVTVANTVSPAPDFRYLAYEEDVLVKSSLQTLQAGTNPTFDFEKSIQKTLAVTTVQAGDFVAATISNIKDGARYSIKFAAPFSTFLSFPANVYKRDGTAFGTYTVMAEILDFVVIGTDLYCVNK